MRQEPGGLRGDAGPYQGQGLADDRRRDAGGCHCHQHMLLHPRRQGGEHRHHPGDGAVQGEGPPEGADRHRLPGPEVPGGDPPGDPGGGRGARHFLLRQDRGGHRGGAGWEGRRTPGGSGCPASPGDKEDRHDRRPFRLPEDRGGMRQALHLLHHPEDPRRLPQRPHGAACAGGAGSGGGRREGADPGSSGDDGLRRGPVRGEIPPPAPQKAVPDRRTVLDPPPLLLSGGDLQRAHPGHEGGAEDLPLRGSAHPARLYGDPEADGTAHVPGAAGGDHRKAPERDPGYLYPHDADHRIPGGDEGAARGTP